jgi:hypothetical protein
MEQVHLHFHKIDFAGTRLFQRHIISSAVTLACILLPHRQRIYLYPRLPNSMCTLRPHLRQWQSSAAPNSVSPSGRQKKSYSAFSFKPMHSLHGYIRLVKNFCQRQLTHVFILPLIPRCSSLFQRKFYFRTCAATYTSNPTSCTPIVAPAPRMCNFFKFRFATTKRA